MSDQVVNAAMIIMKYNVDEVNGLEDVILTKKYGFVHRPGVDKFVQILCIRKKLLDKNIQCHHLAEITAPSAFL